MNYVSFYDALRFANWLNNGQGSGDTETGAYTLLGGTRDAEQRHDGDAQRRSHDLPAERERVVQGGVLRRGLGELLRLPGRARTRRRRARRRARRRTAANCANVVGDLTNVGSYTGSASPTAPSTRAGTSGSGTRRASAARFAACAAGRSSPTRRPRRVGRQDAIGAATRDQRRRFSRRESRSPSPARACS